MSLRIFCFLFVLVPFGWEADAQTSKMPLFKVGILADVQYGNIENKGTRHYRSSISKLQNAVIQFNKERVDCIVSLGDFIDQDFNSFDTLVGIMQQAEAPVYHVLGNHDFSVEEGQKKSITRVLGIKKRYYSFSKANWRFLFLDGTDVSVFSNIKGSRKSKKAEAVLTSLVKAKAPNAQVWNGGIGKKQTRWIKRQMAMAEKAEENLIVLCHYPIFPSNDAHNLWNANDIMELLEQFKGKLVFLCGHTHKSSFNFNNEIYYVSFRGMVENEENSFAIVEVFDESIVIKGFGAEKSHKINWGVK